MPQNLPCKRWACIYYDLCCAIYGKKTYKNILVHPPPTHTYTHTDVIINLQRRHGIGNIKKYIVYINIYYKYAIDILPVNIVTIN